MPQRNVMPTLPNQQNQRQQPVRRPPQKNGGNKGINVKALVILVIVVIAIIVIIIVGSNASTNYESQPAESTVATESVPEVTTTTATEPPEPVELDPSENNGTQITDLLAEGSVLSEANKYTLVTDIAYANAYSVADSTVISLDKNLTLVPSASCAYSYGFNTANITHNSGALLSIARRQAVNRKEMPTISEYTASLEQMAKANGVIKPTFGEVYVGSSKCGVYVKGTLKANKEETTKTILLMHFSGDPEIYSMAAIYNTQDELDLLLNSVKLYSATLKLN